MLFITYYNLQIVYLIIWWLIALNFSFVSVILSFRRKYRSHHMKNSEINKLIMNLKILSHYYITIRGPLQCSGLVLILHSYPYTYPSQPKPQVDLFSSLLMYIAPHPSKCRFKRRLKHTLNHKKCQYCWF